MRELLHQLQDPFVYLQLHWGSGMMPFIQLPCGTYLPPSLSHTHTPPSTDVQGRTHIHTYAHTPAQNANIKTFVDFY